MNTGAKVRLFRELAQGNYAFFSFRRKKVKTRPVVLDVIVNSKHTS